MNTEDFFTLKTGARQGELASAICANYVHCSRVCKAHNPITGNWVMLSVGSWAGEEDSVGLKWGSRETQPKKMPHSGEFLPRFGSLVDFQSIVGKWNIEAMAYEFLHLVDEGKTPMPKLRLRRL